MVRAWSEGRIHGQDDGALRVRDFLFLEHT